jgi:hypothetical protein
VAWVFTIVGVGGITGLVCPVKPVGLGTAVGLGGAGFPGYYHPVASACGVLGLWVLGGCLTTKRVVRL